MSTAQRTTCGGCGFRDDSLSDEGFCFECRTYFKAGHVLTLNLCAWLERWRKRNRLTRAEAVRAARECLDIRDDILIDAMGGEDNLTRFDDA